MATGFNGNGGPTDMLPWSDKYKRTTQVVLKLLSSPDHKMFIMKNDLKAIYFDRLKELSILDYINNELILNISELVKHSLIVDDKIYGDLTDINWLREQRKKLGLIKGDEIKGPEFRARQNARRAKRRAEVRKRKAELVAQPIKELPLSEIIFKD